MCNEGLAQFSKRIRQHSEENQVIGESKDFTPINQFIAYIDILGYEVHLKSMGVSKLAKGLSEIITGVKNFPDFPTINPENRRKFKVFSDNIIVCSETNWDEVLMHAQYIQQYLLATGVFSRGSMVYGELYIDEDFICGQGIIDAYKLESEISIFPRIIIDESFTSAMELSIPKLYERHLQVTSSSVANSTDEFYVRNDWKERFFKRDFDGMLFLDYLELLLVIDNTATSNEEHDIVADRLKHHHDIVKKNLIDNAKNKRVLEKFQWCQNYHNEFCKQNGYPDFIIR